MDYKFYVEQYKLHEKLMLSTNERNKFWKEYFSKNQSENK